MSAQHAFYVRVADLEYGDRDIDEEIPVGWLETALSGSEATPRGTPGRLTVTVSKSGRDVMVRGDASAKVTVPCARTLDPVEVDLKAPIFLLLAQAAPKVESAAKRPRKRKEGGPKPDRKAPRGPNAKATEREDALEDSNAARDIYDGDEVVLDDFVREFLLLELPMFPLRPDLRSDDTTGMGERSESKAEPPPEGREIDPRLAPLAALRNRLSEKK